MDLGIEFAFSLVYEMMKLCGALPERWTPFWDPQSYLEHDGTSLSRPTHITLSSYTLFIGISEVDVEANWSKRRRDFLQGVTSPTEIEGVDKFLELLRKMLVFDPKERPGAGELLEHAWFNGTTTVTAAPAG